MKNLFRAMLICNSVLFAILLVGCDKDAMTESTVAKELNASQLDIGLDELLKSSDYTMVVSPRSGGYHATASGKGTIPSGEYAGWKFHIDIEGFYSGVGFGTLETGSAMVRLRGERFVSIIDPLLQSFCCGEGHLFFIDDEWVFSMTGQVVHTGGGETHNHLFAALATTAGTMNMNIADQSGTVVIPLDPPHDPGIGLIENFDARHVEVIEE